MLVPLAVGPPGPGQSEILGGGRGEKEKHFLEKGLVGGSLPSRLLPAHHSSLPTTSLPQMV